jgi:signal transduction histidine kinase
MLRFWIAASVGFVLFALGVWVLVLRRQVRQGLRELSQAIERHQRTADQLQAATADRLRLEKTASESQRQLLLATREAGMAEVATGVLHNVGNVLNSVLVATNLLGDIVRKSKISSLPKLSNLVVEQGHHPHFLTEHPQGKRIPFYLKSLADQVTREQSLALSEIEVLKKNLHHVRDIIAMQQTYASLSGLTEKIRVSEVVEDTLRLNGGTFSSQAVTVTKRCQDDPEIVIEKHKALQILVNLVRNGRYACEESDRVDKELIIDTCRSAPDRVQIRVIDNGIGIPPENQAKIFAFGFTTRKTGHGFGLHSCAIAAQEMGGSLTFQSEGHGRGATFILELPLSPPASPELEPGAKPLVEP